MTGRKYYGALDDRDVKDDDDTAAIVDKKTDEDVQATTLRTDGIVKTAWCLVRLAVPLFLSSASWVRYAMLILLSITNAPTRLV